MIVSLVEDCSPSPLDYLKAGLLALVHLSPAGCCFTPYDYSLVAQSGSIDADRL